MRFDGDWSHEVIGAAMEVHARLGPGLLEGIYEEALAIELTTRALPFERQRQVEVLYRGRPLRSRLRLDFLVGGTLVVEVKSVQQVVAVHKAQLLTYLRVTGCTVGLLLNFNETTMRAGVHRIVHRHAPPEGQSA